MPLALRLAKFYVLSEAMAVARFRRRMMEQTRPDCGSDRTFRSCRSSMVVMAGMSPSNLAGNREPFWEERNHARDGDRYLASDQAFATLRMDARRDDARWTVAKDGSLDNLIGVQPHRPRNREATPTPAARR